jgi:hypothetical protein
MFHEKFVDMFIIWYHIKLWFPSYNGSSLIIQRQKIFRNVHISKLLGSLRKGQMDFLFNGIGVTGYNNSRVIILRADDVVTDIMQFLSSLMSLMKDCGFRVR